MKDLENLIMEMEVSLLKARPSSPIGSEKIWSGVTYVKTATGWKPKGKMRDAKPEDVHQERAPKAEEPSVPKEKQIESFAEKAKDSQLEAAIKDPKQDEEVKKIAKEELDNRKEGLTEDLDEKETEIKEKNDTKPETKESSNLRNIEIEELPEKLAADIKSGNLESYEIYTIRTKLDQLKYSEAEIWNFIKTHVSKEIVQEFEAKAAEMEADKKLYQSLKAVREKITSRRLSDISELISVTKHPDFTKEIIDDAKKGQESIGNVLYTLKQDAVFSGMSSKDFDWFTRKAFPNIEELEAWEKASNGEGPYSGKSDWEKMNMLKEGKSNEEIKEYFRQKAISGPTAEKKYYVYNFLNKKSQYAAAEKKKILAPITELAKKSFNAEGFSDFKEICKENKKDPSSFLDPQTLMEIHGFADEILPIQYSLANLDRELVCFPFMYTDYGDNHYTSFDKMNNVAADYVNKKDREDDRKVEPIGKISKHYREEEPAATPEQIEALHAYTGSPFSGFMTQYLYHDKDASKISEDGWQRASESSYKTKEEAIQAAEKYSPIIDSYVDENPIRENVVLSRRIDINENDLIFKQITGLKKGDIGKFDSFQSFSYIQMSEFGSYQITLLAKAGDPIANAKHILEFEYISKKDVQFRVLETGYNSMVIEFIPKNEYVKNEKER